MSNENMENTNKVNGIFQIVRLKEILQKWHLNTIGHKENNQASSSSSSGIPPSVNRRIKNSCANWDSDEESCTSLDIPSDVPRGHIPVYVGRENRRFVIPASYLSLPVFKLLLEKAEEEFGFSNQGALSIPCEIETFKYILQVMEQHRKGLIDDEGNPTGKKEEEHT